LTSTSVLFSLARAGKAIGNRRPKANFCLPSNYGASIGTVI